jgi:metal-responsive CopG/Arc/MetJ family transcriptional regulator
VQEQNLRAKYVTVKIPRELATKLDLMISELGYSSRADVVNDAIRRFIDERLFLDAAVQKKDEALHLAGKSLLKAAILTH